MKEFGALISPIITLIGGIVPIAGAILTALIAGALPAAAVPLRNSYTNSGEIINTDFARGKNSLCAIRDKYGFIWMGTLTGLFCYDGNGRQVYPSPAENQPAGSNITTIFEHDDDIWYGDATGVSVYTRSTNSIGRFPYATKYGVRISSPVQRILNVGGGHIFILTQGQGFFVFNENDSTLTQNSRYGSFYSDVTVGPDGKVYVIGIDGVLQVFSIGGGFIAAHPLAGYVTDRNVLRIVSTGRNILVSSLGNIYRYDLDNGTLTAGHPSIGGAEIKSMLSGGNGLVFLGTDEGVWRYDIPSDNCLRITPAYSNSGEGLLDDRVMDLSYDTDGSIIVVTPNGGVSHLLSEQPSILNILLPEANGRSNNVTALLAYPGGLWIGSKYGLLRYDAFTGTLSDCHLPEGGEVEISSLALSGDSLWIGSHHQGLYLYNTATGAVKHYGYDSAAPYAVISNNINQVYRTGRGEIFVLTDWGLCRYNRANDNFDTFTEIDSHLPFVAMAEDGEGNLWTSTANKGLYIRRGVGRKFEPVRSNTLGVQPVSILRLDSRGVLWAVTQGKELCRYDSAEGDFCKVGLTISNASPIIFLEEDLDGALWAGSMSGNLAKIEPDGHLSYYSYCPVANVIPSADVSARMPDGNVVFGFGYGIKMFNPREMRSDSKLMNVYIQSVSFPYMENNDEELKRLGLDVPLYTREKIELPYSDNTFTLTLSASRSGDMPPVRFSYMMEGVDRNWITSGSTEVTYTGLRPGKYTFLLRPDSGTELDEKRLVIEVLPPWYRTWTAYAVYAVLAALFIWWIVKLVRRRVSRHYQVRINEMRIQKEREMFEGKMRFFVNLVHEIRTPLTLISLPLEQLSERIMGSSAAGHEEMRKDVRSMRRNVNYLLGIINLLLDFRKAEHDKEVRLSLTRCDVRKLLTDICSRFEHPMATAGKKITLSLPDTPVETSLDTAKFDRVIMNLIGNAEKYCRSRVAVELKALPDGRFTISVFDDGPGIKPQERTHIFDTYYQIEGDNVAATLGTGLGLAYAKLIASAHGGEISVESNSDGGATFLLTLPVTAVTTSEPTLVSGTEEEQQEGAAPAESEGEKQLDLRVLLVDDNTELLAAVSVPLGKVCHILTADSGEEALRILNENEDIDVIVSDFMMPGMNGVELCRKVKGDIRFSHIPFIILTAKTDSEAKEEGMEGGADVYMEKPFTIKQLRLQIVNILKTRELYYARMRSGDISTEAPAQEAPYLNRLDTEFMTELNDFIRENVAYEELSIDIMASKMNMSRSSFYRKLKAITGMTPVDYLKNFRLDMSARLLLDGERVTEVALMTGFTSSSYFAKCFKAKFGMIPKEYVVAHRS